MALTQPELLRHVNQEIENLWLSRLGPEDGMPVVCECADRRCAAAVDVSLAVFRRAVEEGLFLVLPGHRIDGCEVVATTESWQLLAYTNAA